MDVSYSDQSLVYKGHSLVVVARGLERETFMLDKCIICQFINASSITSLSNTVNKWM